MAEDSKPQAPDPNADVMAALESFGLSAKKVVAWQVDPTGHQDVVGSIPMAEFSFEEVGRRFGGHPHYLLKFYGVSTRENPGGFLGMVDVGIAGPRKDPYAIASQEAPDTAVERERRRADEAERRAQELERVRDQDRFLEMMKDIKDTLAELRAPPPQTADSPIVAMAMEILRNSAARVEPHLTTPFSDGATMLSLFQTMSQTFKDGVELGRNGAEGGDVNPFDHVINRFGVPLLEHLEKLYQANQGRAIGPGAAAPTGEGTEVKPTNLKEQLGRIAPQLVAWAESGADAHIRAALVVEGLPPAHREELVELLTQEANPTAMVLGWHPILAPHRQWMTTFVDDLKFELGLEDGGEGEEEGDRAGELEGI